MTMMARIMLLIFFAAGLSTILPAQTPGDSQAVRVVNGVTYRVHKVAKGETLYKISKQYGCTVDALKKLNKNADVLKIGDELLIPGAVAARPAPVATPPASTIVHVVKKGETLNKIAQKYGTTSAAIKKLNGLTGDALKIGQKLKVPGKAVPVEVKPPVAADTVRKAEEKPMPPREKVEEKPGREVNPGMPEKPKIQPGESVVEKEELCVAKVIAGKMEDARAYVMHPTIARGNIIVVINPANGKMAYCRVIDNYPSSEYNGTGIIMTPAVAEKIGLQGGIGDVKVRFAAP